MAPVEPDKSASTELTRAAKEPGRTAGLIRGFVAVMLAVVFVTSLITADNIRQTTSARYERKIGELKVNHESEINNAAEVCKLAIRDQKLLVEHSQRLGELAREKERKALFQIALTDAIVKLQPKLDRRTADRISSEVVIECESKGLDPILVTALIWVESGFNPMAHSDKGAVGLMQVRYSTWKETPVLRDNGVSAKHKLYWIGLNIECGTTILAKYYEEADYDIAEALYRYNTGSKTIPTSVNRYEILYVNRVIRTTYFISECIRKERLSHGGK